MSLPQGGTASAEAAFVEAFLRANPAWLAEHPGPVPGAGAACAVHGDGVADHMAAMLRVQRERADGLLAAGRATAGLAGRVQDAVLALFRSSDPADCVSGEMPGILAVDAAHLCIEAEHPGARRLPDGLSRACWTGARWCSATRPPMPACCTPRRRGWRGTMR